MFDNNYLDSAAFKKYLEVNRLVHEEFLKSVGVVKQGADAGMAALTGSEGGMMRKWQLWASQPVLAMGIALAAGDTGAAAFKHENRPQSLKALFEATHQAVHVKKDARQAVDDARPRVGDC